MSISSIAAINLTKRLFSEEPSKTKDLTVNTMTARQLVNAQRIMFNLGEILPPNTPLTQKDAYQVLRLKCQYARNPEGNITDETISKCRHMQHRLNRMLNQQPGDEVYHTGDYDAEIMAAHFKG